MKEKTVWSELKEMRKSSFHSAAKEAVSSKESRVLVKIKRRRDIQK